MSILSFASKFMLAAVACSLISCATKTGDSEDVEDMAINVDFRQVHLCSRISPEITVANAPKGTKFFDVRLVENGESERFLGGGTWANDGSGVIPEGALTKHYSGPCPQKNRRAEYVYIVTALEETGGQPLQVRIFKFIPEE